MKIVLSRSSILRATIILIILGALPSTVRRLMQTGDLYLFTGRFFEDALARLSGPGRLRFILQPIVAIFLGARDGVKDARAGIPPFFWALAFHGQHRREKVPSAFASVRGFVALAYLGG